MIQKVRKIQYEYKDFDSRRRPSSCKRKVEECQRTVYSIRICVLNLSSLLLFIGGINK